MMYYDVYNSDLDRSGEPLCSILVVIFRSYIPSILL